MPVLRILFTGVLSIAAMLLFTKLVGNRQVSQMSLFDYINGITIGSIAAELAIDLEGEFWPGLMAIAVYGIAALLINWSTCKSMTLRKFFNGRPVVLFEHGRLYEKNLSMAKMDINEFLTQCRTAGYFDLAQLDTAILETNGQISFLPKPQYRPVNPGDLQLSPQEERPCISLVIDGHIMAENLKFSGNDETWLRRRLEEKHIKLNDVFLATCNAQNELYVCPRTGQRVVREMFE